VASCSNIPQDSSASTVRHIRCAHPQFVRRSSANPRRRLKVARAHRHGRACCLSAGDWAANRYFVETTTGGDGSPWRMIREGSVFLARWTSWWRKSTCWVTLSKSRSNTLNSKINQLSAPNLSPALCEVSVISRYRRTGLDHLGPGDLRIKICFCLVGPIATAW